MKNRLLAVEECAFEPESTEIRCIDCEKPTGEMGTCQDIGFCAECRASQISAGIEQGLSREASEAKFSVMLISLIEGSRYKAKYRTKRVMHFSVNDEAACGARGGPHPMTENKNEVNCKRCVTKG